ncbi:nitroreductase [Sphingobium sp. SA916]|nr:nitroreductase [Sphingobium sp. SA916]
MTVRSAARPILPIFIERWSPRTFDESAITHEDLMPMFEAARWAPSAFNLQPWRFLYALRGDADWSQFLSLLIPWNQSWAQNASALIYLLSDRMAETKSGDLEPSYSHSFDAGAAFAQFALQAHALGFHSHGMTGFRHDDANSALGVPERFRIEAAIAVGRVTNVDPVAASKEKLSDRKAVETFAKQGKFSDQLL